MSRRTFTRPIDVALREVKEMLRRRRSVLDNICKVLAGERDNLYMKNWGKMHGRAKRILIEMDELKKAKNSLLLVKSHEKNGHSRR